MSVELWLLIFTVATFLLGYLVGHGRGKKGKDLLPF